MCFIELSSVFEYENERENFFKSGIHKLIRADVFIQHQSQKRSWSGRELLLPVPNEDSRREKEERWHQTEDRFDPLQDWGRRVLGGEPPPSPAEEAGGLAQPQLVSVSTREVLKPEAFQHSFFFCY